MPRIQVPFYALNAGEVDPNALGRIDLEKLRVAGENMVNFTPTVLGGMHMRPGTKYIGSTRNNQKSRLVPFIFNADTTSLIEISGTSIRVRNNDALVVYPSYSTTITNGAFTSALGTGWTNVSTVGASATISGGALSLNSAKYAYARVRQTISVASIDTTVLHALRIVVATGDVTLRIGTAINGDNVVGDQALGVGTHFIAFTPQANTIYLEIEANNAGRGVRVVTACDFVKNQIMEIPSPWPEASLSDIRSAQSGSIVYLACKGSKQYKIERRGPNSWGLAEYRTVAGPYVPYSGRTVMLRPSAVIGNITLTANQNFFKEGMVGAVFEFLMYRQYRSEIITGPNQTTEAIKVTGVGEGDRAFTWGATYGSGASGTIFLERAFGEPDGWAASPKGEDTNGNNAQTSITSTGTRVFSDSDTDRREAQPEFAGSDNNIVYYRLRSGNSVTGPITAFLNYSGGTSQIGVVRITGYTSPTSVTAEVITELGTSGEFTDEWREGAWSNNQSWPSAVSFHDGRLWWGGLDKVYGSVSDDFSNYDPNTEGDSGPIVRSIATGPVENIGWLLSLQRLIVGTASAEVSIRSSSFDEPLTPSQFTARNASTMGSAGIQGITVDSTAIYVQKNRTKIYELVYDVNINDYSSRDLTRLNKYICKPGAVDIAVQRQPDTRVWFVKSDGTMAMLVYERADDVVGWSRFETDGFIEAVCVLPSQNDDIVYIVVRRVINGQTVRHVERLTVSSETEDGDGSFLVDSSVRFTTGGGQTTTITGLQHLSGKQVVAKGGSSDPAKLYTVSPSGQITIDNPVTSIVVGLPYEARFRSVKLAYGTASGTALTQKKRVDHLAIVANNAAPDGISIGRNFSNMTRLSKLFKGRVLSAGEIVPQYDYDATSFGGAWDSDCRVCIKCVSPYPAHILGMVVTMNSNDKVFQWPKKPKSGDQDEEEN
jgi:hypothetical protein